MQPVRDRPCVYTDAPEDVALELSQLKFGDTVDSPPTTPDSDEVEQPDTSRSCESARSVEPKKVAVIGEYEILKTIGVGAYSKVKQVRHTQTSELFAIKIMSKVPEHAFQPTNEILAMQRVHSHPNIVTLHKVLASSSRLFLVLDYASNGDLFEIIVRSKAKYIEEAHARHYFVQLINAVDYLHHCGVCHRDIKAENCLVNDKYQLMLSDFGFSKIFQAGEDPSQQGDAEPRITLRLKCSSSILLGLLIPSKRTFGLVGCYFSSCSLVVFPLTHRGQITST